MGIACVDGGGKYDEDLSSRGETVLEERVELRQDFGGCGIGAIGDERSVEDASGGVESEGALREVSRGEGVEERREELLEVGGDVPRGEVGCGGGEEASEVVDEGGSGGCGGCGGYRGYRGYSGYR